MRNRCASGASRCRTPVAQPKLSPAREVTPGNDLTSPRWKPAHTSSAEGSSRRATRYQPIPRCSLLPGQRMAAVGPFLETKSSRARTEMSVAPGYFAGASPPLSSNTSSSLAWAWTGPDPHLVAQTAWVFCPRMQQETETPRRERAAPWGFILSCRWIFVGRARVQPPTCTDDLRLLPREHRSDRSAYESAVSKKEMQKGGDESDETTTMASRRNVGAGPANGSWQHGQRKARERS